jgi:hypothetical protein
MRTICLLLIFIIILSLSGCKKCVQNKIADLRFSKEELKVDPYSSNEHLTFIGSSGDTVVFQNGFRLNNHRRVYKYDSETAKVDHDGCAGDYFDIDEEKMMMADSTLKTNLFIFLDFLYSWSNPSDEKTFHLSFGYGKQPLIYFDGIYKFNADTLLNMKASNPKYDSIVAFHPIWESGSNIFYDVYELFNYNSDVGNTPRISTAYYSIKEGLLGFKTTSGTTWNIKK